LVCSASQWAWASNDHRLVALLIEGGESVAAQQPEANRMVTWEFRSSEGWNEFVADFDDKWHICHARIVNNDRLNRRLRLDDPVVGHDWFLDDDLEAGIDRANVGLQSPQATVAPKVRYPTAVPGRSNEYFQPERLD
jgi:hypothetical protein